MGGAIRVITIKDEKINKQTRWTNHFPNFVHHEKFMNKNSVYWDNYINTKSMYSSSDDDFSPNGYGLIILDYDNKRIFDCQGYSSLRHIPLTEILLEIHNAKYYTNYKEANGEDYFPDIVKGLFNKGLLKGEKYETYKKIIFDLKGKNFNQIMKKYDKLLSKINRKNELELNFFYIDWEKIGWNYKKYPETVEGYSEYFNDINKLYPLTDQEKQNWLEWIDNKKNFEKE